MEAIILSLMSVLLFVNLNNSKPTGYFAMNSLNYLFISRALSIPSRLKFWRNWLPIVASVKDANYVVVN